MLNEESWEKFLMASIDYKMLLREEWKQQKKKKRAFMPRKNIYLSHWIRRDLFEECTQKKLIFEGSWVENLESKPERKSH